MHEKFLELGLESPYDGQVVRAAEPGRRITTRVPIDRYGGARLAALRAHATQIDPESPFWFGLPDEVLDTVYPWEDWQLAQSRVPTERPKTTCSPACASRGPSSGGAMR